MRVWAVAALLFGILVLSIAACGGSDSPTSSPTTAPVPTATVAPTPTVAPTSAPVPTPAPTEAPPPTPGGDLPDPDSLLESAAAAMAAVTSFHFDVELVMSIDAEGQALEIPIGMTGDFQAPDRAKGKLSSILEPGFEIESEFVIIGPDFYMRDPLTGEWARDEESSLGPALGPAIFPPDLVSPEGLEGLEDLVLTGEEVLGGVRTWRLSGSGSADALTGDGGLKLNAEVWIGVDDLLIHGVTMNGDIGFLGDLTDGAGGASISFEVWLSDYGVPVSIEAPELMADIPAGAEVHCATLFDLTVSGGAGEFTPEVTSFRCLNTYLDVAGSNLAEQAFFVTPADHPVELRFGAEQAPSSVEVRLYLPQGGDDDSSGQPEPVESLTLGAVRDVSHVFAYGPGEYTLAVHAVWGEAAEAFYAMNLRLE